MTTLVIGATGRLLVEQLLEQGESVKLLVRSLERLPASFRENPNMNAIQGNVYDLSTARKAELVENCTSVAFCLGHNLTFKGLLGHPRRLVTASARGFCDAIRVNNADQPTKFLLMNTAGNSNRDRHEPISFAQKCVIVLLRAFLPPHVDNEKAADYLRSSVGQHDPQIEWVAIRPDDLTDETTVTGYTLHQSPIRSAIFDAGKTSRINVAHFIASLITDDSIWTTWQGQMPVTYNVAAQLDH